MAEICSAAEALCNADKKKAEIGHNSTEKLMLTMIHDEYIYDVCMFMGFINQCS